MGDQATFPGNNSAAYGSDAKGKGKAMDDPMAMDVSMDEEEEDSDESDEELVAEEDEDDGGNLEPISSDNIIAGGRRTRGKNIDFQEAEQKYDAMEDSDEEEEDEDFTPNNDNKMRG